MSKNLKFQTLNTLLAEIQDVRTASAILSWDQLTHMPNQGSEMRGRQLSTLGKIAHEKFTSKEVGELLKSLEGYETQFSYDSYEASLLRLVRKEYDRSTKLSGEFVAQMLQHQTATYDVWVKARAENNFNLVLPYLEKTLEFSKKYAQHFQYEHIADPLIAESDEGFTANQLRTIFSSLRKDLVYLIGEVTKNKMADDSCLNQFFPIEKQEKFNRMLMGKMGYDYNRGRLDTTHHPFMTSFSHGDVRITTRYKENDISDSLFSCIHEMGHAFYELGVDEALDGTFLYGGTSSGVHESQSRLWENIVARSKSFWTFAYPLLQEAFPENLAKISMEQFYAAINKVSPSLIRTDADELTYNLHVMIRFDLELDMLEGNLKVKDLPAAWNERYKKDLGVDVPSDANGCLQDVHWFGSLIGGQFQGYTLGNMMSAQFYQSALKVDSSIQDGLAKGDFLGLRKWLTSNLYSHGKKFTGREVLKMATGQDLSAVPYVNYLKEKFLPSQKL